MRIAILMSLSVSWSRETAYRFTELGHEVHAIDFEREVRGSKANYLGDRHDIHTAALARLRDTIAGVYTIPGDDTSPLRYVKYAPRLRSLCRTIRPDVLLSLWGGGFAAISYASGIRPYAVYVCGGDILRVSGIQKAVSRHTLEKASIVFANGSYFSERTRIFAPRARVHSAYLGVDTEKFVPGASAADPVKIICTRGFHSVYNNSYLVEALALLPEDVPDFRVVFTSAGNTLAETRELADRILKPELRRKMSFLNGVTDEELLGHLQSAHIYTSVSRYDGTSISLLEALSCGLFPVLSDIPPNREWIDAKSPNGLLVPLDRPAEYAGALRKAILDASWRERARGVNRGMILDRADGRKTMAFVAATLEKTIGYRNSERACA